MFIKIQRIVNNVSTVGLSSTSSKYSESTVNELSRLEGTFEDYRSLAGETAAWEIRKISMQTTLKLPYIQTNAPVVGIQIRRSCASATG